MTQPSNSSPDSTIRAPQTSGIKNSFPFFLRLLIFAALYSILIYFIDFTMLKSKIGFPLIIAILTSALLVLLQAYMCTLRWRFIGTAQVGVVPPIVQSFWIYFENMFVNQFLPSTVGGDIVRVIRWQRLGVPGLGAASSVLLDRLAGLNGAAALVLLFAPILHFSNGQSDLALISLGLGLSVLAATIALFIVAHNRNVIKRLFGTSRIGTFVYKIASSVAYDPVFAVAVFMSIIPHLVSALAVYAIAIALGIPISFVPLAAISSLTVLATVIPVSIAGWGIREMSFVAFLAPFGVIASDAFLIGFATSLGLLLASLPGGLVTLFPSLVGNSPEMHGAENRNAVEISDMKLPSQ